MLQRKKNPCIGIANNFGDNNFRKVFKFLSTHSEVGKLAILCELSETNHAKICGRLFNLAFRSFFVTLGLGVRGRSIEKQFTALFYILLRNIVD